MTKEDIQELKIESDKYNAFIEKVDNANESERFLKDTMLEDGRYDGEGNYLLRSSCQICNNQEWFNPEQFKRNFKKVGRGHLPHYGYSYDYYIQHGNHIVAGYKNNIKEAQKHALCIPGCRIISKHSSNKIDLDTFEDYLNRISKLPWDKNENA